MTARFKSCGSPTFVLDGDEKGYTISTAENIQCPEDGGARTSMIYSDRCQEQLMLRPVCNWLHDALSTISFHPSCEAVRAFVDLISLTSFPVDPPSPPGYRVIPAPSPSCHQSPKGGSRRTLRRKVPAEGNPPIAHFEQKPSDELSVNQVGRQHKFMRRNLQPWITSPAPSTLHGTTLNRQPLQSSFSIENTCSIGHSTKRSSVPHQVIEVLAPSEKRDGAVGRCHRTEGTPSLRVPIQLGYDHRPHRYRLCQK